MHETTQFSIRIPIKSKSKLEAIATQRGMRLASLIRCILDEWLSQDMSITEKDKILTQGLAETVYILRALSEQVNPALKDGAKQYSQDMLDKLVKAYTESD